MVIGESKSPEDAAREMMKRNPDRLGKWLAGVSTFDGKEALPAVKSALGL
jgi:glycine betaine/proline transport system substrate-binding protein